MPWWGTERQTHFLQAFTPELKMGLCQPYRETRAMVREQWRCGGLGRENFNDAAFLWTNLNWWKGKLNLVYETALMADAKWQGEHARRGSSEADCSKCLHDWLSENIWWGEALGTNGSLQKIPRSPPYLSPPTALYLLPLSLPPSPFSSWVASNWTGCGPSVNSHWLGHK